MPDPASPKKTTEELLQDLGTSMMAGFQEMGNRFAKIENRQDDFEAWRARTSERVRGVVQTTSSADLAQEAALAEQVTSHQALAKDVAALKTESADQLAILGRLDKFASSTLVKRALQIIVTIGGIWLALHAAPPAPAVPQVLQAAPVLVTPAQPAPVVATPTSTEKDK